MRQLILFRHAKAVPSDESMDDFDRGLAEAGQMAAPVIAASLKDAGAAPDIVLVSTARRTRETWALARPFFPKADVRFLEELYHAPAETLMREAERAGEKRVMLIAHNPGLHELAARLARRNTPLDQQVRAKYPTAAAALFERKDDDAAWKLMAFLTPKSARD